MLAGALPVHAAAGLAAVVPGGLAPPAPEQPGRHPRAGRVYLGALVIVMATATRLAAIRWREDAHLFAIAVVAAVLGGYGYRVRWRRRPGWPVRHAVGMGGSYIALLTAFYVDNGPVLPVWNRLPHLTYRLLPTLLGAPLIWLAVHRFHRRSAPPTRRPGAR